MSLKLLSVRHHFGVQKRIFKFNLDGKNQSEINHSFYVSLNNITVERTLEKDSSSNALIIEIWKVQTKLSYHMYFSEAFVVKLLVQTDINLVWIKE